MTGRFIAAQLLSGGLLVWGASPNDKPSPSAAKPSAIPATAPARPAAPVRKAAAPAPAPAAQKPPSVLDPAVAAAPVAVTSQPAYRRFVHPDAKAMAGIDLSRLASSPLGKKFATQLDGMGFKRKATEQGLDFVSEVDKVIFSSPGEAGSQEGKVKLSEEAPFVVAMQGRFKIDKLRRSLVAKKAVRHIYRDAEVWAPPKKETALAIVNSQVMLLGDVKSIRAALDAHAEGGNDEDDNPVAERAGELAAQYDVWLVADASLDGFSGGAAASVPQAAMLKGIDQFELGLSLREGLKADVSLHGKTPEDTSKLGTMLAGLKALAELGSQETKDADTAAMLDKLKIGTDGERVVVSMKFSQKEIESFVTAQLSPKAPRSATAPTTTASATPPPVQAAKAPLVVKIYNAEGGDREFQLNR